MPRPCSCARSSRRSGLEQMRARRGGVADAAALQRPGAARAGARHRPRPRRRAASAAAAHRAACRAERPVEVVTAPARRHQPRDRAAVALPHGGQPVRKSAATLGPPATTSSVTAEPRGASTSALGRLQHDRARACRRSAVLDDGPEPRDAERRARLRLALAEHLRHRHVQHLARHDDA